MLKKKQEGYRTFQIIFILGIFCHLLDQELLSYHLLCSSKKSFHFLDLKLFQILFLRISEINLF